jgi:hypothetical protein
LVNELESVCIAWIGLENSCPKLEAKDVILLIAFAYKIMEGGSEQEKGKPWQSQDFNLT